MIIKPTGFFKPAGSKLQPPDYGDLISWVSGDGLFTLSGSDITSWNDESGHGTDWAAPATKPELQSAVQNGLPGVYFDGGFNTVLGCPGLIGATTPAEVFFVIKSAIDHAGRNAFGYFGSSVGASWTYYGTAYMDVGRTTRLSWAESDDVVASVVDCLSDTNLHQFWVNGASRATDAGAATPAWPGTPLMGLAASPFTGWYFEMCFYGSPRTAGQRANVNAYLKTKWATP
jgi:hypothetical protein